MSNMFGCCTRLPKIKEFVDASDPGATIIPFSGSFESKLVDMSDEEKEAFLKENNAPWYVYLTQDGSSCTL